jgi:hypothetical protein
MMGDRAERGTLMRRKAELVAQGKAYRSAILTSQRSVKAGLSMNRLAKSAVGHVVSAVCDIFKSRQAISGINLQTLLPLAISGISAFSRISKKSLLKSILRGALVAGTVATAVAYVSRKKNARQQS